MTTKVTKGGNLQFDFKLAKGVLGTGAMITKIDGVVSLDDATGSYTLQDTEEGVHFTAKDNDEKELFNGLIETEEAYNKIPAEMISQVEKMEKILFKSHKK